MGESKSAVAAAKVWPCRDRELDLSRVQIMGILNVTPDSFSDGGRFLAPDEAVAHAREMAAEGAAIIDVGAESTRPGAEPVGADEQLRRILPVVERLAGEDVLLSIDTSSVEVARTTLEAGAHIINDVTALRADPHMAETVAEFGAGLVLMHMQGTPRTMQQNPAYDDVAGDIRAFFRERMDAALRGGVAPARIVLDPGIGFGKTLEHNLEILRRLGEFRTAGRPILIGPSRKSFLGTLLGLDVDDRLEGTLAAVAAAVLAGASIVRVHDVRANARVVRVSEAIRNGAAPTIRGTEPAGRPTTGGG
jgi:dihydropteroate synthase